MMKKTHLISLTMLTCIAPLLAAPKEKQTQNPAIVFMIAGQSNAGGCGIYSPEMHKELGRDMARPLVPGTTAVEVGLPTDAAAYTHSYIWMPNSGFERLDPMVNTRPPKRDMKMHGMELPVVHRLEKRFPDNDIYVIKHGPSGRNLHHDWNPALEGLHYARLLDSSRKGLAQLSKEYPEVRVIGLYWDQGEADTKHADAYAANLSHFIATFRKDSGLPELKVFIRKHIYRDGEMEKIIAAQEAVVAKDKNCFLLDIELDSLEKNYATWSYTPNNIHINSKAFMELAKILMEDVLKNPKLASFDLSTAPPLQAEHPGYLFTLKGAEDESVLSMNNKNLELKIKCPKGLGKGRLSLRPGAKEWPEKIVILLRYEDGKPLPRLEGFGLKAGQKIIQHLGGNQDVVSQSADQKTDAGLKIVIPGNLLAGESEVLIEWIDFYRR